MLGRANRSAAGGNVLTASLKPAVSSINYQRCFAGFAVFNENCDRFFTATYSVVRAGEIGLHHCMMPHRTTLPPVTQK
jgi:hypothetical protein